MEHEKLLTVLACLLILLKCCRASGWEPDRHANWPANLQKGKQLNRTGVSCP
jgi:hypothetical protein